MWTKRAAARAWAGYRRWTAWLPVLTSGSAVWALIFNHFCSNWGYYLILSWLPRYFALRVTPFGSVIWTAWLARSMTGLPTLARSR